MLLTCFCLQVLQFNVESRTWKEIGKLQLKRYYHAIAEANLIALCQPAGNLKIVKKIINIIIITMSLNSVEQPLVHTSGTSAEESAETVNRIEEPETGNTLSSSSIL